MNDKIYILQILIKQGNDLDNVDFEFLIFHPHAHFWKLIFFFLKLDNLRLSVILIIQTYECLRW